MDHNWELDLADLPGTNKTLNLKDIDKWPTETRMAYTYLSGHKYTRKQVQAFIKIWLPKIRKVIGQTKVVGSYRRKKPLMNDVDLLIIDGNPKMLSDLANKQKKYYIIKHGVKKARVYFKVKNFYIPVDINFANSDELYPAMLHHTGSVETNIKMRAKAKAKGYKLNEYGLWKNNKKVPINSEKEIFELIGLKYLKPTER